MAHRYWRVRITRAHVTPITAAEVEFRATPGGADETGSGTAFASAGLVSGTTAAGAFANDGATTIANFTASTSVNGMNEWLAYDFGAGNEKEIVEFAWTIGATASRNPRDCLLEYSDDNVVWYIQGAPFNSVAAALSNATTVYTASALDAEFVAKAGTFVLGSVWPTDGETIPKAGFMVAFSSYDGSTATKVAYEAIIAPTPGGKVSEATAYTLFDQLPSARVSEATGYILFRPIPTPPRKTIVIIGPGRRFGGSGIDNPLFGDIVQDSDFAATMSLPQNMAGALEQDQTLDADLFVDNAAEDIFMIADLEQTSEFVGSTSPIPHNLAAAEEQEQDVVADLFVDNVAEDIHLIGDLEQINTVEGHMTQTHNMVGAVEQTSSAVGSIPPPDARYWRLHVTASGGATGLDWHEVQFLVDSTDQTDPTTALTAATASSTFETLTPPNAFDNIVSGTADRWASDFSGTWPQWLMYDFGAGNSRKLNGYTIRPATVLDRAPGTWTFQWSADGVNWNTVDTRTGVTTGWSLTADRLFTFTAPDVATS